MKRLLIPLLCLLLLAGCLAEPQSPSAPSSVQTEATQPTQHLSVPLLEQGEKSGNLVYIPNSHVEAMSCPEMRLYGNGLLLYEHTMEGVLQLRRISLEDGRLLAQATYSVSPAVRVQVGSGVVGLCDSGTGQVLILNESLTVETTYTISLGGDSWYLNQEMDALFLFFEDQGLLTIDLESGEQRWLLNGVANVRDVGASSSYVLFSYVDRADQRTYNRCLSLSAGNMETVPLEGTMRSGIRGSEYWLFRQDIASGQYTLVVQDTAGVFYREEGMVELLSGRRQLLVTDDTYRNLYLYDLKGAFLSQCALPQIEYASVGTDLVWSGYWQGYFFRDTYDDTAHLMFWDLDASCEGEDLAISTVGSVQMPEPVLEQAFYDRAEELTQRFGIEIRIAEQCSLDYTHYDAAALTDPYYVQKTLDTLEEAFSAYPEGFLQQLPYGEMHQIRIEIVANLRAKEDAADYPALAGGFAQSRFDHYLIVLEGWGLRTDTVYHELSHVIDKRLEWDASLRPEALFTEEKWLSLQPEGFRYANSYVDMPADTLEYEFSGYFVRKYGMTFPTEDRATLMELAMTEPDAVYGQQGMAEKMRYYAECIRDCFDTEGWPSKTRWE